MHIMYVDESGTEDLTDDSPYYITSGTIVDENYLSTLKREIKNYKDVNFVGDLSGSEIHLYDMYNCRNHFKGITTEKKWELINNLYDLINQLDIISIATCVDKQKFKIWKPDATSQDVIAMGYNMILERFQMFLQDKTSNGIIRVDKTTDPTQYKLNLKDRFIIKHTNRIRRKHFVAFVKARNVIEEILMLDSSTRKGLQVADAVAYCTTRYLTNHQNFLRNWNIVKSKLRTNPFGKIEGFGLIIFPK